MAVAVRAAGDSSSWVAVAELATANVVTRIGAKLGAIQCFEQAAAADLTGDCRQRVLCSCRARSGILRGVSDARTGAAVCIAHQDAAGFIYRDVVEVEQIAARIAAATVPNATALHRVRRRSVDGGPSPPGVVRERYVQVPDTEQVS